MDPRDRPAAPARAGVIGVISLLGCLGMAGNGSKAPNGSSSYAKVHAKRNCSGCGMIYVASLYDALWHCHSCNSPLQNLNNVEANWTKADSSLAATGAKAKERSSLCNKVIGSLKYETQRERLRVATVGAVGPRALQLHDESEVFLQNLSYGWTKMSEPPTSQPTAMAHGACSALALGLTCGGGLCDCALGRLGVTVTVADVFPTFQAAIRAAAATAQTVSAEPRSGIRAEALPVAQSAGSCTAGSPSTSPRRP